MRGGHGPKKQQVVSLSIAEGELYNRTPPAAVLLPS